MNEDDGSVRASGDPMRLPSAEELRMVRSIAQLALLEAARHGAYRATFRGFRVQATRQCVAPDADAPVEVHLCVRFGETAAERGLAVTIDAGAMELLPLGVVI